MPKPRISLRMIKDVIRLKWQADHSHEQIAFTLNISKGAVTEYVGLAHAGGLDWETVQDWSEQRRDPVRQQIHSARSSGCQMKGLNLAMRGLNRGRLRRPGRGLAGA